MNFIEAVKKAKEGKRVYRKYCAGLLIAHLQTAGKLDSYVSVDFHHPFVADVLSKDWEVEGCLK